MVVPKKVIKCWKINSSSSHFWGDPSAIRRQFPKLTLGNRLYWRRIWSVSRTRTGSRKTVDEACSPASSASPNSNSSVRHPYRYNYHLITTTVHRTILAPARSSWKSKSSSFRCRAQIRMQRCPLDAHRHSLRRSYQFNKRNEISLVFRSTFKIN